MFGFFEKSYNTPSAESKVILSPFSTHDEMTSPEQLTDISDIFNFDLNQVFVSILPRLNFNRSFDSRSPSPKNITSGNINVVSTQILPTRISNAVNDRSESDSYTNEFNQSPRNEPFKKSNLDESPVHQQERENIKIHKIRFVNSKKNL